jgi:hypothetical protein
MQRVHPVVISDNLVKIMDIYNPIIEYIELILEENKISLELESDLSIDQVRAVYNIIIKLNEIIILKCEKKDIKILNVETLMDYLDMLCDMLLENSKTSKIYDIMTLVGKSLEDNNGICQGDTDIEMQRWRIMYSLLSGKVKK